MAERKVPAVSSPSSLIPSLPPKTPGTPRAGAAWPPRPQSSPVAREPPAVCVGFHVSDFCFIPTFARALLEPCVPRWTALHCATLRPGCDPALPAPSPGTVGTSLPASVSSWAVVPVSWKRPSVPVEQNARPHCRQHEAERLGTRPLTRLCSLGLCARQGWQPWPARFCASFYM